jgi:hypothetical protein
LVITASTNRFQKTYLVDEDDEINNNEAVKALKSKQKLNKKKGK